MTAFQRFFRSALRFASDTRGATAVVVAVSLTTLIGLVGLGAETGLWFGEKRGYQTAADAGALAGAWQMADQLTANVTAELNTGNTALKDGTPARAWPEAVNNGAPNSSTNISITQLSNPTAAQVVVTVPKSTLLARLFLPSVTIQASAVATVSSQTVCDLALAPTGTGIENNGNVSINIGNCWLVSNSSSACSGQGVGNTQSPIFLDDSSVSIQGNMQANGCINLKNSSCAAGYVCDSGSGKVATDPFASQQKNMATDITNAQAQSGTTSGLCQQGAKNCPKGDTVTTSIGPGLWDTDITLAGTVTLPSGVYYMNGTNFNVSNATVTGTDVTIVLTGAKSGGTGELIVAANGNLTLTATGTSPACTSGCSDFQGLVLYQDPNAVKTTGANAVSFAANSTESFTGAIYAPSGNVAFQGTPAAKCQNGAVDTCCLQIVSYKMSFGGDSSLDTTGCSGLGVNTPKIYTAALTQ